MSGSFLLGAVFFIGQYKVIDFAALEHYNPGTPSIVLDDHGNEWARFALDRRDPVQLEQMPDHVIKAFLAAEDWKFFQHRGISFKGIARSLLVNLYHGRRVQGASTITQQLVRLLFFDAAKTIKRKIKEQIFAVLVERQFTKEQILQTYLNHVYFGCGIYGVQAACQRFWGKDVSQITIDEAAVLASIMRSPKHYCPLVYPLSCQKRRNVILNSMRKLNFITAEQCATAQAVEVTTQNAKKYDGCAPHLKETLRMFLEQQVGKQQLYNGGLVIQTTLNKKTQQAAEKSFTRTIGALKKSIMPQVDGALISIDPKTGGIKALVGGADFSVSKFNRALQARRQMGSIFKPLVYATALQQGATFADIDVDEPFELEQHGSMWKPNNYTMTFDGPITLARALSRSNNIVTIKTLLNVGAKNVCRLAKKCHIQGPLYPYPALALGCVDATLQEAVGMFNVFANNGVYVEPHYITWIKDKWGTKIYKIEIASEKVLEPRISGQVAKVLTLGLQRVRKHYPPPWLRSEAISKTGTTNDSRTCWFVGSTPRLTTAVYVGPDDNRPMGKNIFPLRTAFPIWLDVYRATDKKRDTFSYDSSLQEIIVHEKTGKQLSHAQKSGAISILV